MFTLFFRRILQTLLLLISVLLIAPLSFGEDSKDFKDPINWIQGDLNDAFRQATESGRDVYLVVTTQWCYSCKDLKERILSVPEIANYINQTFIPVKIDADETPEILNKYTLPFVPTTLVFNNQSEEKGRLIGSENLPETYFFNLKKIAMEGQTLAQLKSAFMADPSNPLRHEDLLHKYIDMGLLDEAKNSYQEMQNQFPTYFAKIRANMSFSLGEAFYFVNRLKDAVIYFHDVTISDTSDKELLRRAYNLLIDCYDGLKDLNEIRHSLNDAINAFPYELVFYRRALVLALTYKELLSYAFEQARVALALDSNANDKGRFYFLMALVYESMDQKIQAISMIDEAIKLDSDPYYIEYRKKLLEGVQ